MPLRAKLLAIICLFTNPAVTEQQMRQCEVMLVSRKQKKKPFKLADLRDFTFPRDPFHITHSHWYTVIMKYWLYLLQGATSDGKQAVMWLRIHTETETSADRIQESLTTIAESRNFPFHSQICRCHAEYFITEGEECTLEVYIVSVQSTVCTVMSWISAAGTHLQAFWRINYPSSFYSELIDWWMFILLTVLQPVCKNCIHLYCIAYWFSCHVVLKVEEQRGYEATDSSQLLRLASLLGRRYIKANEYI